MEEKEFEFTSEEGYSFYGWITKGKWPEGGEVKWSIDFGSISSKPDKWGHTEEILDTLQESGAVIENLPIFSSCWDYITSKEFWERPDVV